jgi:disulfide bond formation protein DsbB
MSVTALHDFFAILAIIAAVGVVLMVLARIIPAVVCVRFLDVLHKVNLWLAALVATTATLGSLWFSEHFGWIPCRFCWYQRCFMYPLAVILIVAAIRKDRKINWYAVPLATIGILISLWHNLLERGLVEESKACAATTPCAVPNLVSFGHRDELLHPAGFPSITLAVMAFCGFAAILALLLLPEPLEADLLEDEEDGKPTAG